MPGFGMSELPEDVSRTAPAGIAGRRSTRNRGGGTGRWTSPFGASGACQSLSSTCSPDDPAGLDAIELGCGTAYVSAWLLQRGAPPVGIDNSAPQLASPRRFQQEFRPRVPLLHGNAEAVPLPDESFDLPISEYGASIWCDPYAWIPEAARLLRPGGQLAGHPS
jgi:ubiquinone/menaquinone biosynthesis C-methylase UbiE